MNNNHVNAAVNQGKGKVKEEVGHAIGNNKLAGEGVIDQVKGKIQEKVGDAKDALKESLDRFLNSDKKS